MSNRYSSPYYRPTSPYAKDYHSPLVSDSRYSSPYRSDERDVYNASRGYDIYSRDHGSPGISRNVSFTTNDLDRMIDTALARGHFPQPPPPTYDPPLTTARHRSPSPASRRYHDDVYNTTASRPYYRPKDDLSLPIDNVGYGYRSSSPYRSMDGYRSRDPSPRYERDNTPHTLHRMPFERGDDRPNYRYHDATSRFNFDREYAPDVGDGYYYMERDGYHREREYAEDWGNRYERDHRIREDHFDTSIRAPYDNHHYYDHEQFLLPPLHQRPYEDQRAQGNRYNSPLPSSPGKMNDAMNASYKSAPKEIKIPMQHDYSTVLSRQRSSTRSFSSKASVLSTWHDDDVVLLPKGHQVSEAAVAATAAASLIADDSSRICGIDTAADRISDFVKPGKGKDALSSILSTAVLGSPLQNHSHVPLSYTNMQENMKRDLLVTATVNATRDKKLGSLPLDAYQFWSRCTLLVATAILKTGSNNTQIAHAAAEIVMSHGIGTIHQEWKSTAEEDLKHVADAVHDVVANYPGGSENIASIATIALLSEGSKTLAIERIRESEPEKPPIGRPKHSKHFRKNSEENIDGIQSIRNTGSLLDNHSSNEEEDNYFADKNVRLRHTNSNITSRQLEEQLLQKNKDLEKKRGELAERISRIQKRAAAKHDMSSVLGRHEMPNHTAKSHSQYTNDMNRPPYASNHDSKRSTNACAGSESLLGKILQTMNCSGDHGDDFYEERNFPQQTSNHTLMENWEKSKSVVHDPPIRTLESTDHDVQSITYAKPYPLPQDNKIRSSFSEAPNLSSKDARPKIVEANDAFSNAIDKGLPPIKLVKKLSLTPTRSDSIESSNDVEVSKLEDPVKLVKKLSLKPTKSDSIETSNDVTVSQPDDEPLTSQNNGKKPRFKMRFGKRPEKAR